MGSRHAIHCLPLLLLAASTAAQGGMSQARLEDDCLQRLRPIVPRDVKVSGVDFSALGAYATYFVVSYKFAGELENGKRVAACTYRREGQWVRDDAASHQLLRDLESSRRRSAAAP
ncbi:hypothetical protein FN976_23090 [Caenimonas sedimenti]|uniref:Uncharacterized protein n=1 Tax=Caenimonas sedimenti TaxID=2596921 RepID=A0A562ZIW6_9BURK|nr:hypothetical protein [Caenimonas sedimenti]TWO68520.1 hypothetical protein FN976_23090 [Caenimonas sedimenti]